MRRKFWVATEDAVDSGACYSSQFENTIPVQEVLFGDEELFNRLDHLLERIQVSSAHMASQKATEINSKVTEARIILSKLHPTTEKR